MGYTYAPLSNTGKSFRLLKVEPGTDSEPVRCSLHLSDLSIVLIPAYETISYCWGDATLRETLELDGQMVSVPASSVAAIRRVRLTKRYRVLWIDALCIDQGNIQERNQQVAMMTDVYTQSQGNLIYLGESDGTEVGSSRPNVPSLCSVSPSLSLLWRQTRRRSHRDTFALIRDTCLPHLLLFQGDAIADLHDIFEEAKLDSENFDLFREMNFSDNHISRSDTPLRSDVLFDALYTFLSRPWFR